MLARFSLTVALGVVAVSSSTGSSFTVLVYNVENLHDVDGVARYDDYQPGRYSSIHLATKITNIAQLLQRFNQGAGPDILLLQEIEIDQTPATEVADVATFLQMWEHVSVRELLSDGPLDEALAGVPAEVWLMKALSDAGLTGYAMVVGDDASSPSTQGSGHPARSSATPGLKAENGANCLQSGSG